MDEEIRLQKYLAGCGVSSRRKCEGIILEGRVKVNGVVITKLGARIIPGRDKVFLDGEEIELEKKKLFIFNKPANVVTTIQDQHKRSSISDFITGLDVKVFPVGRLDYDVRGLLILTNDGDFSNTLLHPRYEISRVYVARVKGNITKKEISFLKKGFFLEDGFSKAHDARLLFDKEKIEFKSLLGKEIRETSLIRIEVKEGRNHFVKRLLKGINHPVINLGRIKFGPFSLGSLKSGKLKEIKNYTSLF